MNYKIELDIDEQLLCGKILFDDKIALIDFKDFKHIINNKKCFSQYTPWENYLPYYMRNNNQVNILEHIYNFNNAIFITNLKIIINMISEEIMFLFFITTIKLFLKIIMLFLIKMDIF